MMRLSQITLHCKKPLYAIGPNRLPKCHAVCVAPKDGMLQEHTA